MISLIASLRPFLRYGIAGMSLLFMQAVTYSPPAIDHAAVLKSLNQSTLTKGKEIYLKACAACHGTNGTASLPQARSFTKDALRFGNRPYDMWKTITNGAGMMAAQTWLSPEERYFVIQYIRESFIRPANKPQYFSITPAYLASLPKSSAPVADQAKLIKVEAKKGSLQYGQEWFSKSTSDYGQALYSQLQEHTTSALTVSLRENHFLSYDLLRMRTTAMWEGSLNVSQTKYKLYRGEGQPQIKGTMPEGLQTWKWIYSPEHEVLLHQTGKRSVPEPSVFQYHGHYAVDRKVILSYAIEGREILEMPGIISTPDGAELKQQLTIAPGASRTVVLGAFNKATSSVSAGSLLASGEFKEGSIGKPEQEILALTRKKSTGVEFIAAAVKSSAKGLTWTTTTDNRMLLTIPASSEEITITIIRKSGTGLSALQRFGKYVSTLKGDDRSLSDFVSKLPPVAPMRQVLRGVTNAARPHFDSRFYKDKDKTSISKLVNIPFDYPYTVDHITLPYDNRYNAWIRPTALAFRADGSLFVSTYVGDVWLATGVDSALKQISWQRVATGLYEPMGMKMIDGNLLVTCRNGIMKLHDLNGDEQIDFYEQMHADHDVSSFFHAFNFGLEKDSKGNLYYVKPGEYTDNKDPGNVMRVSADGKHSESIATGFRVNNGITISPDDQIFVSDNQGNWTPSNKINVIEPGKYYGYVPNLVSGGWSPDGQSFPKDKVTDGVISSDLVKVPETFTPPALWIPQEFDNSPGGGTWSDKAWGPLGNSFIHTSYGTGWCYYVLPKKIDSIWQAAMIALPFQFDAGIQRAAVNPIDKNVYVTGLTGWDDGVAKTYGILSRIRYTGGQGHFVKDVEVIPSGIRLKFNFALDGASLDTSNISVSMWNYKWTSNYGSAHYSVLNPGTEGEDRLAVSSLVPGHADHSLDIELPALQKAQSVRIRLLVRAADGTEINESIYMTINKMPIP